MQFDHVCGGEGARFQKHINCVAILTPKCWRETVPELIVIIKAVFNKNQATYGTRSFKKALF